jgi:hypothetical protein
MHRRYQHVLIILAFVLIASQLRVIAQEEKKDAGISRDYGVVNRNDPTLHRWLNTRKGDVFILKGEFTQEDEEWFKDLGQTVTLSKLSPKRNDDEAALAAKLTLQPFNPKEAIVMNALPYQAEAERGRSELARMKLRGRPQEWRTAQQEVSNAGRIPVRRATKMAVLREFEEGSSNVLFVIAHSDSNAIFLPGVAGGKITIQELDRIARDHAPDRAIVLLACKAGAVNGQTQSLAETLIKNRLATVVFASDELVYTKDVAEMLRKLQENAVLGEAFDRLRVMVRFDEPDGPWERAKPSEALLFLGGDGPAGAAK